MRFGQVAELSDPSPPEVEEPAVLLPQTDDAPPRGRVRRNEQPAQTTGPRMPGTHHPGRRYFDD